MAVTEEDPEIVADKDPASNAGGGRVVLEKFGVELGPLGHLANERHRLDGLTWNNFTVKRYSATVGAELHGVDITSTLSDEVIAEIQQALWDYKVIFFRDQKLTPDQHVAFAQRFGELEIHPFIPSNTGQPELVRFEKGADVGGYENGWHHDVTWRECPSRGAILHALKVPASGGDTLFCDANAAYQGLDDETRAQIDGLTAVHDFMLAFGGNVPADKMQEMREKYPLVEHPVVSLHPDTGRKLLYVNPFFVSHIKDMDDDESAALIARLCKQFMITEYQCRFHWEVDSVAFWDNRAVQHYASSDYFPDIRIMERASVKGPRPA